MAKENDKDQKHVSPAPRASFAGNGNGKPESKTDKSFEKFKKDILDPALKLAEGNLDVKKTALSSAETTRQAFWENYLKAEEALSEYHAIHNNIAVTLANDIAKIKATSRKVVEADGEIGKLLGEANKAIKASKDELAKSVDAANKLKENFENPCNSEVAKRIVQELPGAAEMIDAIIKDVSEARSTVDQSWEGTGITAAIRSFNNLDRLEALSAIVKEKIDALKANVSHNIEFGSKALASNKEALSASMIALSNALGGLDEAQVDKGAIGRTLDIMSKLPDPDGAGTKSFNDIATEAEENWQVSSP